MLDNTDLHQFFSFFGRRLRTVRKSRELSVEFMVEAIREYEVDMSVDMYNRIERGSAKPNVHIAYLLAEILSCTVYDFLPPQHGEPIPENYAAKTSRILSDKLKAIENIIKA